MRERMHTAQLQDKRYRRARAGYSTTRCCGSCVGNLGAVIRAISLLKGETARAGEPSFAQCASMRAVPTNGCTASWSDIAGLAAAAAAARFAWRLRRRRAWHRMSARAATLGCAAIALGWVVPWPQPLLLDGALRWLVASASALVAELPCCVGFTMAGGQAPM